MKKCPICGESPTYVNDEIGEFPHVVILNCCAGLDYATYQRTKTEAIRSHNHRMELIKYALDNRLNIQEYIDENWK